MDVKTKTRINIFVVHICDPKKNTPCQPHFTPSYDFSEGAIFTYLACEFARMACLIELASFYKELKRNTFLAAGSILQCFIDGRGFIWDNSKWNALGSCLLWEILWYNSFLWDASVTIIKWKHKLEVQ